MTQQQMNREVLRVIQTKPEGVTYPYESDILDILERSVTHSSEDEAGMELIKKFYYAFVGDEDTGKEA